MQIKQIKKKPIYQLYNIGDFIDAKDNQGDWRVGYIIQKNDITKLFKIRFDGWASKYDQYYKFDHPKLKQFRDIVYGYTGQKQNPAIRPSWKFNIKQLQNKIVQLNRYLQSLDNIKTGHQFNQYIRGSNYLYTDFLMTLTYNNQQQIHRVMQFFKLNIILVCQYLKHIKQNFNQYIDNISLNNNNKEYLENLQIAKQNAYYQIFDMIYTITGSYLRLIGFFQSNQILLRKQLNIESKYNHKIFYQKKMIQYFMKNSGLIYFNQILTQITQTNKTIPFMFLLSFTHLYNSMQILKRKQQPTRKFKLIMEKILQNITDKQMKDFNHQQALNFINQIIILSEETSLQYQIPKWAKKIELEIYYKMITCQYFQKKLKGITLLYQFIQNNQELIVKGQLNKWIKNKKIFDILLNNDNPQIIKKTNQIIKYLYIKDIRMQQYIQLIWKYKQGKHQTVLKQIYSFISDIPLYNNKNQQFILNFFNNYLIKLQNDLINHDYIKMIKQYSINALYSYSNQSPNNLYGFNLIYQFLLKYPTDHTISNYLLEIFEKINNIKFKNKFVKQCFNQILKHNHQNLHVLILLKIIQQKHIQLKNIDFDSTQLIQNNIILRKNEQSENIIEKLQLLTQILKQLEQVIPYQNFIQFWQEMIISKNKTYFLKWLYKVKDSGRIFITNFIQPQTKQYLIQKFWTKQYFQNQLFDEVQAIFLLELFKNINTINQKIKRSGLIMNVLNQDLIGLDKLHLAYQLSNNQKASSILAKGMAQIYFSGSEKLESQNNSFLGKFILKIADKLIDYSTNNQLSLIIKSVKLIEELLLRDQQIYNVNPIIRKCILKDLIVKNLESNEEKIIKVNIQQTFYTFKKIISQKFSLPLHKFDISMLNNQKIEYQHYFMSLSELGITNKVFIQKRKNQTSRVKFQLNRHLQLLFELLGKPQIEQKVWSIVSKLPISDQLRNKITQSPNTLQILQNQSLYKQLYMLKVALSINQKWWNIPVNSLTEYIVQNFMKLSLNKQIQRQYLMVSMKIIQKIVIQNHFEDVQTFKLIILSSLQMIKKQLLQTNNLNVLNTETISKTIQSFFIVGQKYNKFLQANHLSTNEMSTFTLILEDKNISDLLILSLISYKHEKIRRQFPVRLAKLAIINKQKHFQKLVSLIFNEILDFTVTFEDKNNLRQFNTFSIFILDNFTSLTGKWMAQKGEALFRKLFQLVQKQQMQKSSDNLNVSLFCYLSLMRFVIINRKQQDLQQAFNYFYYTCLFKGKKSKCKNKQTKNALFNLFIKIMKNQQYQQKTIDTFIKHHRKGAWRTRRLQDWIVMPNERSKSTTGYTGLRNLGCICYMNSFFQQIFMIEQFRMALLECQDSNFLNIEKNQNVLYQVKKMFINLMYSDKKAYNPKSFCISFKDYQGRPTNVNQQMDIDQFSGILFDRIQNSMKGTKYANLIKETFGGVFSNQIICKGCPHFSESQQSFLSLSLTVKDKKSIYESLQTMIKGDTLDGDNAYYCQRCNKKVSAVKRVCLKSLPDHLIVTLKRFEFDYMTMTKLKVNEYCQFPHQLNLQEYSYDYLRKKQNPNSFEVQQMKSNKYYDYKLKGVVIHTGYADSGHYYSLIQQRNGQKKWMEFNDTIVKKFNIQNLNQQAFGGQTGGIQSKQKIKNAYMLIYQRIQKLHTKKIQIQQQKTVLQQNQSYKQIFVSINQQNFQYKVQSNLFSAQYQRFINCLIDQQSKNKNNLNLQKFIILNYLTVVIRTRSDNGPYQTLQKIYNSFGVGNQKLNQWILEQFTDLKIYDQFFRNNPIKQVRKILAFWLLEIIKQLKNIEIKTKFLKTILYKLTIESQNNIEALSILFYLADNNQYSQFLIQNNIIGRMIQNIIRKQPKVFGLIQNFKNDSNQQNYLGYEQIIEKTPFQLRKMKYDNQSGYVWGLAYKLISKYQIKNLSKVFNIKECQYMYLNRDKIYKLLQQVKGKFQIDSLTNYLVYLSVNNQDFCSDLLNLAQKGIKDFQSKRYPQFFLLFDKLLSVKDNLQQIRITGINNMIRSLKDNQKYPVDCSIIQLWLCKIINENQHLRNYLRRQRTIIEHLYQLPLKRIPSDELSKKHINYSQTLYNKLFGIPFPTSKKGYTKLLRSLQNFYEKLLKNQYQKIEFLQSGNHIINQKYQKNTNIAYFDVKQKIDYDQCIIQSTFLHRILLSKKNVPNKTFWVWEDDQKLSLDLKVTKRQNYNDLDSSKTTQMQDQQEFDGII